MSMCSVSVNVQYLDGGAGLTGGLAGHQRVVGTVGGGAATEFQSLPPPPPPSPAHSLPLAGLTLGSLNGHGLNNNNNNNMTGGLPSPHLPNGSPVGRQLQHHLPAPQHHLHQLHQLQVNQVNEDSASARWTHYQQLWRQHQIILNGKNGTGKESPEQKKDDSELWSQVEAQAAFLGPNLWDKTLPYDADLKYVDLDEFLSENGIPVDVPAPQQTPGLIGSTNMLPSPVAAPGSSPSQQQQQQPQLQQLHKLQALSPDPDTNSSSLGLHDSSLLLGVGPDPPLTPIRLPTKRERSLSPSEPMTPLGLNPPSPADSTMSFASSSRDFDPRTRPFSDEELKPQPMIKKSRKQFVPEGLKDEKYWARRRKNNMAAKRSRDARRMKENQIALRAGYLEKENMGLRQEIERLKKENLVLRDQVAKFPSDV